MDTAAVIVAAGRGRRVGGDVPKQWRMLRGRTVLAWTLDAFRQAGCIDRIVLVLHPDDMALAAGYAAHGDVRVAAGGATRRDSVLAGLESLEGPDRPGKVLIHDVARPLVAGDLIARVARALERHPGAAPALPVTDALWRGRDGSVAGIADRSGLFRAQTPQGFHFAPILAAHRARPGDAADDVEVARAAGLDVAIIAGDERNLKITTEGDFARAEALMEGPMDIRCGNGFDVHAFTTGDHVVLCGVRVPHDRGLLGHSDADVGMHAVTDAILGALAEGDIGQHFPPSDPQWKGAPSHLFLRRAADLARSRDFRVSNVDCTLICERPKIGPHVGAMRAELAAILDIGADRVAVKATTSERLGFTGREEGIAAIATATLTSR